MRYDFVCTKCATRSTVDVPMKDFDTLDRTCPEYVVEFAPEQTWGDAKLCGGTLERDYTNQNVSLRFAGAGWTPKHY